jgi:hypothetical protein
MHFIGFFGNAPTTSRQGTLPFYKNQGHLNQKATLIRPFQFSIFPYKLCFCDISGGRTFLRSIYRFQTQSIETFFFYFEVKCLKRQVKHECYKISKIRAYFGYIHYFDRRIFQDVSKLLILKVILLSCYVKTRDL